MGQKELCTLNDKNVTIREIKNNNEKLGFLFDLSSLKSAHIFF